MPHTAIAAAHLITPTHSSTAKEEEGVLNNRLSEICQLENGLVRTLSYISFAIVFITAYYV